MFWCVCERVRCVCVCVCCVCVCVLCVCVCVCVRSAPPPLPQTPPLSPLTHLDDRVDLVHVLHAHVEVLVQPPLTHRARHVEHRVLGEDGVGDHEDLALEGAHGGAVPADLDDDALDGLWVVVCVFVCCVCACGGGGWVEVF